MEFFFIDCNNISLCMDLQFIYKEKKLKLYSLQILIY